MTRFGTDEMYMYDGSTGASGDMLEPIKDQTHWYEESIKVNTAPRATNCGARRASEVANSVHHGGV